MEFASFLECQLIRDVLYQRLKAAQVDPEGDRHALGPPGSLVLPCIALLAAGPRVAPFGFGAYDFEGGQRHHPHQSQPARLGFDDRIKLKPFWQRLGFEERIRLKPFLVAPCGWIASGAFGAHCFEGGTTPTRVSLRATHD